jgi:hypothetical protein
MNGLQSLMIENLRHAENWVKIDTGASTEPLNITHEKSLMENNNFYKHFKYNEKKEEKGATLFLFLVFFRSLLFLISSVS